MKNLKRRLAAFAAAMLLAAGLPGCGEKSQELAASQEPGYRSDAATEQMRARTLRQDEYGRIAY